MELFSISWPCTHTAQVSVPHRHTHSVPAHCSRAGVGAGIRSYQGFSLLLYSSVVTALALGTGKRLAAGATLTQECTCAGAIFRCDGCTGPVLCRLFRTQPRRAFQSWVPRLSQSVRWFASSVGKHHGVKAHGHAR